MALARGSRQDGRGQPSDGSASDFPRRGRAYGVRSVRPARTAHSLWEMGQDKARLWAAFLLCNLLPGVVGPSL